MPRFRFLALIGACVFGTAVAHANPTVLIAASDPAQIVGVEVAKVTDANAPLWLSVKAGGRSRFVLVTSESTVEPAKAADAWLRALDFSTRVRVTPPSGPLAACTSSPGNLADSGFPEAAALTPVRVSSASSEVELRRSFSDAGLDVDVARVSEFTAGAAAPYRVAFYEADESGGLSSAVRLTDSGAALALPGISTVGRNSVPLTFLGLAETALLPATASVSDPSEFAVSYSGANASTDYVQARGVWLAEDPTRWLLEARASSALFGWTVVPGAGEIQPALSHYLNALPGQRDARLCFAAIQGALARESQAPADFACSAGDDLVRSLNARDFGRIRLTRLFGSIGSTGAVLRAADEVSASPGVVATDFDAKDCPPSVVVSPGSGGSTVPSGSGMVSQTPSTGDTSVDTSEQESESTSDSAGCTVTGFDDSCSGDSSSSSSSDSSSSDSCSGDSSSDSSSSDSCSGDSSSDSSSSDSCSGDSSSTNSDDSSGCGKSSYDGDTCSGSSSSSAAADTKTTAALSPGSSTLGSHRSRRVHLSLITLFLASIALPLRRKKLWRTVLAP